jgi:hypothetical protein
MRGRSLISSGFAIDEPITEADEAAMKSIAYYPSGAMSHVDWMNVRYTHAPTYYREVILAMPREDGIILGSEAHLKALSMLSVGGLYVSEVDDQDIYVDGWRVNGSRLQHKHPEFGHIRTGWAEGIVEADLTDGRCDICHKEIPGEIDMMHSFYKL